MSKELNKALELLREIRPSIPKDVLELWCKDRDAFLASHKETVEQAGGDERAAFFKHLIGRHPANETEIVRVLEHNYSAWKAWQARAALAQPSPKCATCNDQCAPLNANDELMTVAQHAASVARWAEMLNRVEQERDVALARVAELERQEPVDVPGPDEIHQMAFEEGQPAEDGDGYLFSAEEFDLFVQRLLDSCATPVAWAQHSGPEEFIGRLSEFLAQRGATGKALLRELRTVLAAAPGTEVPQAWLDVQAERRRQVTAEGWTPEHDDEHNGGELADAAACYALWAGGINPGNWREFWPWAPEWLKHSEPRRMLVKAGALILAEIERLDRAAPGKEGV
ncbi:hypothetical protein [Pseudomonas aeruginosa]|uniref:hypothetical protein n=1 Tax=Pseudomonas aeruginosa TaxID=287 RepID=UPI001F09008B|nr:hypothetical protein [Pseudomonas aeruginosa]